MELLNTLAAIRFGCVDIAFGVRRYAVYRIESSWLAAAVTKRRQNFHGVALKHMDLHVRSISYIEILLLRVSR